MTHIAVPDVSQKSKAATGQFISCRGVYIDILTIGDWKNFITEYPIMEIKSLKY